MTKFFLCGWSNWRNFVISGFLDSKEPGAMNFRPIERLVDRHTYGQSQLVQRDIKKSRTIILNVIRNTYTNWIIYMKWFRNNWWFPMFWNPTERVDFDHMFAGQPAVRLAWNLPRPVLLSRRIHWWQNFSDLTTHFEKISSFWCSTYTTKNDKNSDVVHAYMMIFISLESSQRVLQIQHDQSENRKNVQLRSIKFFHQFNTI